MILYHSRLRQLAATCEFTDANEAKQNPGETMSSYHSRLRQLAATCEFTDGRQGN